MHKTTLLCAIALFCASAAFGVNIVSNPGFESGTFAGSWTEHTCSTTCGAQGVFVATADPHTGTYAAETRCVSAACLDPVTGDWISQVLTTTAATTYTLSFWMDPVNGGDPTVEWDAFWNGVKVGSFSSEPAGYHQFIIGSLLATGATSTLEFTGRHDPATVWLDDVCVSSSTDCGSASSVPEPTSAFLLSSGLAGIGLFALRRRRARG